MTDRAPQSAVAQLTELLPVSPDAHAHNVDLARGLVLIVRLDAAARRSASFLDDRILGPAVRGAWLPGATVDQAARRIADPRPLHFIFHTGHVGSTLLSRLLDETGLVLSLREPLILRTIADAHDALDRPDSLLSRPQFGALLDTTLRLWHRGYDWTRAVVVKATSSAGRVAATLLAASPESRATYLNVRAEPYLATLLGGTHSAADLRGHGPGRIRRLAVLTANPPAPLHGLSTGELAALGWLVESMARQAAMRQAPGRVLALDFDEFMTDVPGAMRRALGHFGLPFEPAFLEGVAGSAVLARYSKAPEQPFPTGERARRLAESRRENRAEIGRGLAWLDALARAEPAVAAAVAAEGGL